MSLHKKVREHIRKHLRRHKSHMDNQTPAQEITNPQADPPPVSPAPKNTKLPVLLLVIIAAVVIGAGIYLYLNRKQTGPQQTQTPIKTFEQSFQQILAKKGQFQPDAKMLQIGEETIYGEDLNNIIFTYFNSDYATSSASLEKNLLDKVQEQSIILQEGKKAGLITLSQTTFNSPNKNLATRSALVSTAEAKLKDQVVNRISGESISIWFNNGSFPTPKMGIDGAKKFALAKMESIYNDLKSGKITFLQARDRIVSDTSIKEIDPAWKSNAYTAFNNVDQTQQVFNDPEMNKKLWQLKQGEISPILTANDFGATSTQPLHPYEALFKIIKINKITGGGFASFNDWLNSKKAQYEIKKY